MFGSASSPTQPAPPAEEGTADGDSQEGDGAPQQAILSIQPKAQEVDLTEEGNNIPPTDTGLVAALPMLGELV